MWKRMPFIAAVALVTIAALSSGTACGARAVNLT